MQWPGQFPFGLHNDAPFGTAQAPCPMTASALPVIAILAAGGSTRMRGRDKLRETVGGMPLLRLVARRALETGAPVLVTLPEARSRDDALEGLAVDLVRVPDADTGMAASFRAIAPLADGRAVMVVLADMPDITAADMRALIAQWQGAPDTPLRAATAGGQPGQPVIFPASLVPRFAELQGDAGGRALLSGQKVELLPLAGDRAVTDLDTPEAWDAWRARTGQPR